MITVITGASKGIGRAIAERFIREGSHLAICSRHEEELHHAKNQLQALNPDACIMTMVCDLGIREEAQAFGEAVLNTFSMVDVLVNNAGRFLPGELSTESEGTLEAMIATNLFSAYHLTRTLLPVMIARRSGHIFNMSSVAGLQAYPQGGSYSISKFALEGFSKNLREELKELNIKVTTVQPGATLSDSWKGSGVDENRIMQADDIAQMIWAATQLSPQAVVEEILLRPQLGDL